MDRLLAPRIITAAALGAALALSAACNPTRESLPAPRETPGAVVPVDNAGQLPSGHPEVPIGEPASNNNRVGRAARRLSVDQLRASLLAATGFTWVARRRVSDPEAPGGTFDNAEADMLEALAATLGRPDYVTFTNESIDPAVTFAKLSSDGARAACRMSVAADVAAATPEARRLLRHVAPADTLAMNPTGVRQNLSYLALRFWGRQIAPGDPQLAPLATLFERASTLAASRDPDGGTMRPAATPADGWRAVCIAMATDPQFLTY